MSLSGLSLICSRDSVSHSTPGQPGSCGNPPALGPGVGLRGHECPHPAPHRVPPQRYNSSRTSSHVASGGRQTLSLKLTTHARGCYQTHLTDEKCKVDKVTRLGSRAIQTHPANGRAWILSLVSLISSPGCVLTLTFQPCKTLLYPSHLQSR